MRQTDQTMPSDLRAEMRVLGAMIKDEDAAMTALDLIVDQSVFYHPGHQVIFTAIREVTNSPVKVDLVTLSDHLDKIEKLVLVGGTHYLTELIQSVATTANIEFHINILTEKYARRSGLRALDEARDKMASGVEDTEVIAGELQSRMLRLQNGSVQTMRRMGEWFDDILEGIEDKQRRIQAGDKVLGDVPTGLYDLDRKIGGFEKKDVIIIAARPSVGKTALACRIAENVSRDGPVLFLSLEMAAKAISERLLFSHAHCNMMALRVGQFETADASRLMTSASLLDGRPLYVEDSAVEINQIVARSRRFKYDFPDLRLIIIDYIQLIKSRSRNSRNDEISDISSQLKATAKYCDCPVVALSQLNRAITKMKGSDPDQSNASLRDGGAIEQDADVVMILKRLPGKEGEAEEEAEYDPNDTTAKVILVDITKYRNGAIGKFRLHFFPCWSRFESASQQEMPEYVGQVPDYGEPF